MRENNAPLGVFDSGLGGLTIVREILKQLPQESVLYFADTAHVPYGSRDPEELRGFAFQITAYLVKRQCKMIIIACNTSTALAYDFLRSNFNVPLVGVIEPGVSRALQVTANGKIGIIGTLATIQSGVYQKKLKAVAEEVVALSCPPFVELVEKGKLRGLETEEIVAGCLAPLQAREIDTLILGCTHYPFLSESITRFLGPKVKIVDPAEETVRQTARLLKANSLSAGNQKPRYSYFSSKNAYDFKIKGSAFLGRDLGTVKEIYL